MARLAGKVAFITGGGGGIGRATAIRFAEEGAKVVVAEIDAALGAESAVLAKAAAGNSGGDDMFVETDVTDRGSVADAVAATVDAFGGLTVLHNNAGGSGRLPKRPRRSSGGSSKWTCMAPFCAQNWLFRKSSKQVAGQSLTWPQMLP